MNLICRSSISLESCWIFRRPFLFSSGQLSSLGASELLVELCKSNNATTYLAGPSGKDYLNEDLFVSDNISVDYHQFTAPTYDMDVFSPGLSTSDLIMRFGPRAAEIIQSEARDMNKGDSIHKARKPTVADSGFSVNDYVKMFKYDFRAPFIYFFERHLFDLMNKTDTHKRLLVEDYREDIKRSCTLI